MQLYLRGLLFIICLAYNYSASATSVFHGYITDLSPPYICKLKLKGAEGVSLSKKHYYYFSGICSIKIPVGTRWIYQNLWADVVAEWDGDQNWGKETTTFSSSKQTVVAELRCDDDPWLTKAQCSLEAYQNNTQYTNLGGVYNERTGLYPPFETITGQYPPLARNQAILQEAIALSLSAARHKEDVAQTVFNQTFSDQPSPTVPVVKTVRRKVTKIYRKPKMGNLRVDCCLKLNKECGKPAADSFCRSMGFKQSVNCKIDSNRCTPTFIIGTQTICSQPFCKGFDEVECSN
ncbi:MAG: hypothetical protein H0U71_00915 [Gammaproteobacteria bacterium]|nr:hypothetical protein [Gammaproteobacteria bacterium]